MTFYFPWEIDFLNALQGIRNPILDKIMVLLSTLGNAGIFWLALALILLIVRKTRYVGLEMFCAMLLTFLIGNLILKPLVNRTRPWVVSSFSDFPKGLTLPKDASFPSGHTMNGVTASLILFLHHKVYGAVAIVLALLIAFSRMYNYCHFPTDVLCGIAIGVISAVVMHLIFAKWKDKLVVKTEQ